MFDKYPKIRIAFVVVYLLSIIQLWDVENSAGFNIIVSLLLIFCAYISLVKAEVIHDKKAKNINETAFDIISIGFFILLITSKFSK